MAAGAPGRRLRTGLFAGCCVLFTACAPSGDTVSVSWAIEPALPFAATDTVVRLRLSQPAGGPVRGAKLRLEAHMTHPGMRPVEADVEEERDGNYRSRLQLSMPGDWLFVVAGTVPGGGRILSERRVAGVRAPSRAAPER